MLFNKEALVALLVVFSAQCFAQNPGALDPSFGIEGKSIVDIDDLDQCQRVIRMNNHIYVAGYTTNVDDLQGHDFFVKSLNLDGSINTKFGSEGLLRSDFEGGSSSTLQGAAVQGEKILLLGTSTDSGSAKRIVLIRIDSLGNLDESFGDSGQVSYSILGEQNEAHDLCVTQSLDILICGTTYDSNYEHRELPFYGQLYPEGQADTSFTPSGFFYWDPANGMTDLNDYQLRPGRHAAGGGFYSIATNSADEILVGGVFNASSYWGLLVKYSDNGHTESYAPVTKSLSGFYSDIVSIGEEFYVNGEPLGHVGPEDFVLQSISEDLAINEESTIDFDDFQDQAKQIILDKAGRLVQVGYSRDIYNDDPGYNSDYFALHVFDQPFISDPSFGSGGSGRYSFDGNECGARSAVSGLNAIYVAGYIRNANDENELDVGIIKIHNPDRAIGISNSELNNVRISPNPAESYVQIRGQELIASVRCINIEGQNVEIDFDSNAMTVAVTDLAEGLYLLSITTEQGIVITKRLIVN